MLREVTQGSVMMNKRYAVVLAAGMGTRMKSDKNKMLHEFNGLPMVGHVIRAVSESNVERIVTIVGHGAQDVQDALANQSEFAFQDQLLGTAHAVIQAKDLLANAEGNTLIICGDTPLFTAETLNKLFKYHEENESMGTVLTATAPNPGDYGRIVRDEAGNVTKIVEAKDSNDEELLITEINTGTFVFNNRVLFQTLDSVGNNNAQGEYYLTDLIEILNNRGDIVKGYLMEDFDEAIGVNDRVRLAQVTKLMTRRINEEHMLNGVTFVDPDNTYIERDVVIGNDTVLEPGVVLKGKTVIGKSCHIGAHTELIDTVIGSNVVVRQSVLESATIEDNVTIGPFAHLRAGAEIGSDVHIGNFVEVKKSIIGPRAKAGHLSYIGDAIIGEDVNVGSGTTVANFDGKYKHKTTIGKESFIGSGSILVAPVNIGDQSIVAAGSVITEDIDSQSLGIGRAKQVNKANYWKKFNNK